MTRSVVIVGSSIAGVRVARALRTEGFQGRVTLVGEEDELPYDKPPLSKELLLAPDGHQPARLLDRQAAADAGIELRLGCRAEHLDLAERRVVLADGSALAYDHAVIATGAHARPSPWTAPGVHVLRTLDDARALRKDLRSSHGQVVVIGAGVIGAEVASSARTLGRAVTMVDPLPIPMARVVGDEVSSLLADLHRNQGTELRLGTGVMSVDGGPGAYRVGLADGTTLDAGTVVVGIGATPNDSWLRTSGLMVDDGIVCDEYCEARRAPGVFAVGDVARTWRPHLQRAVRCEHWTNAVEQATCVAHNIAHPDRRRSPDTLDYVWSDQCGAKIQIVGRPTEALRIIVVRDPARPDRFCACAAGPDDVFLGSVTVDWPRASLQTRRLMQTDAPASAVAAHIGGATAANRSAPTPRAGSERPITPITPITASA